MDEPVTLPAAPSGDADTSPTNTTAAKKTRGGSKAAGKKAAGKKAAGKKAAGKKAAGKRSSAGGASSLRGGVPGGKALARLNMFLIQRGVTPEPTDPPPPAIAPPPELAGRARAEAPPAAPSHAADLVAGFHYARRQLAAPAMAAAAAVPQTWQPLGPYYIPHGQSYGKGPGSRPPVAGRISAIVIDPGDDRHVLCGSAGGGVWETRDGGRTWSPRTDDQPSLAIGALAYDPSNPGRVYAGTGEGDTAGTPTDNVRAAGLLVSDDGGTTWALMPGSPFVGVAFYEIVVDPSDGRHILAATTNGLYETLDGGAKWERRITVLTWSVSMHPPLPTNPDAGREVLAGVIDGLRRSTNGGKTWTKIPMAPPAGTSIMRVEVRHAPSNGSVAYVFAAFRYPGQNPPPPAARLWRRGSFGATFEPAALPPDLETKQAWYDWVAAVAPNNPNVLYLGAINLHRGVRQPTGKWTWDNLSAKKPTGDCVHPDQHVIAFSPADPNVVYAGNDGGVYRSPDAGVSWEPLNRGLSITEVEFLAQHPEYDAWLLAGTQDNGTIRYEGQQTWYHVQDGDGGDCDVYDDDPYTCYHSFYGPYIERSEGGGAWRDWQPVTPDALNNELSLFYPPLEANGVLLARGATRLWLSRERGEPASWQALDLGLPQRVYLSALAAPTPARVYAGSTAGDFFRADWDGAAWSVTALNSPAPGYVSDIVIDPANAAGLWCSVNVGGQGGVHRSTDGGGTWEDASGGLPPNTAVHAIEVDPDNPATLFAGMDVGVFRTDDGGTSWAAFGRGLPNALVKDVLLHPKTRLLRAGTQARGVWEIALDAATMPEVHVYLRDHAADTGRRLPSPVDVPNPFEKGTNMFWWQSPDIKVDASPFRVKSLDDLDFDVYADDRSKEDGGLEFAAGLRNERPVRGQMVRVYVQAHNRGSLAARNVAVRLFYVAGGLNWPDLPAGFWAGFPANNVPADSPWQPVAEARVIPEIATGRSAVVGFDWSVPLTIGGAVGLLAVISAENDTLETTTLSVPDLVRNSRYCGLRNLAVVNPSPVVGPWSHTLALDVWPTAGSSSLHLDAEARALVRGVVVSKALARVALKAGWKEVRLTKAEAGHLARLTDARPELKKQLDLGRAFSAPTRRAGIDLPSLSEDGPRPVVLLLNSRARRGAGSVVLREADGSPTGGLTIVNLAGEDS